MKLLKSQQLANDALIELFQLSFPDNPFYDDAIYLALNPSTSDCKTWAWLGDAFLLNELSKAIYCKEKGATIEELHQKRERYKTNEALTKYLVHAAPELYRIIQGPGISYNNHSVATCFEALLYLTVKK